MTTALVVCVLPFSVCYVQFSSAVKAAIFSSFIKFCKCIFLSLETAIQGIANIMFECFYEQRLNKYILTNTYLRYFPVFLAAGRSPRQL